MRSRCSPSALSASFSSMDSAAPGRASPQPVPTIEPLSADRVRRCRELRDEHGLAELRRREHHEPSLADDGAHRSELRLGGGRNGRPGGAHQRSCAPPRDHHRQLLGGPDEGVTRILIPLSLLVAVVLVTQGVVQNFTGQTVAQTLEGIQQRSPVAPSRVRWRSSRWEQRRRVLRYELRAPPRKRDGAERLR